MKRRIACGGFWALFFVELFVFCAMLVAVLRISSDVDFASAVILFVLFVFLTGGVVLVYRLYDPLREKYCIAQETPLTYHRIVSNIGMPLGVLLNIVSIITIFLAEDFAFNSLYLIDLVFRFTSLILACICLVGLRKLRAYAWRALMANLLVGVLYAIVVLVIYAVLVPFLVSSAVATMMWSIYGAAIIALYYYKRKNLFFIPQLATSGTATLATENEVEEKIVLPSPTSARVEIGTETGEEDSVVAEPAKFSLSPVDKDAEKLPFGGTPACELAIDKDVQSVPNIERAVVREEATNQNTTAEPVPTKVKTKRKYCARCGNVIDSATKKCTGCGKQYFKGISWKLIVSGMVGVLLVSSCVINVCQYVALSEANDTIANLQKRNVALQGDVDDLKSDLSSQKSKIEFFDEHVVFVEDDGTKLFHKYECERFVGNYYWAYNVELARYNGYKPCSRCH